jgi:hypothetical protein
MNKRDVKKLTLSRETLHRLEERRLRDVAGAITAGCRPTNQESICWCWTDVCASEGYTLCVACES